MTLNATAWRFIDAAETAVVAYLKALVPDDVLCNPALSAAGVFVPSIAVRNTSVRPYTQNAAIIAHVEAVTTITVRTAMEQEMPDAGRENHAALVALVVGAVMVVDETTHENALQTELTTAAAGTCAFSMAEWNGSTAGADDENRHFVTKINLACIINPPA